MVLSDSAKWKDYDRKHVIFSSDRNVAYVVYACNHWNLFVYSAYHKWIESHRCEKYVYSIICCVFSAVCHSGCGCLFIGKWKIGNFIVT